MKANVKKKLFPNGKKTFLYLTALLALSSFFLFLPGCAKVDAGLNLLANANFTNHTDFKEVSYAYTDEKGVEHNDGEAYNAAFVENKEFSGAYWSKQLPKDWTVRVSDEKVASFKGFDRDPKYKANSTDLDPEQSRNYAVLKINAAAIQSSGKNTGYGWIQLSQKIRVNPDSYYRITFQYKGAMSVPDASTGRNESYAKLFAGAAEDPSFIPAAARTVSISATTAQTYTLDVGSGNLRALTLTINVGAPGHEMGDSEVKVSGVSIYELAEKPDSNPHVLYKNGGFHATAFKAALWIAGGFIVFAVLCWFAVHFLTLNFVYHKPQEKIDGAPIGGGRGKGGPAKGGPNKGKAAVKSPPKFVKSVKKGPKSADLSADDGGDTLEVPFPNGEEEPAADTVSAAPVKTTSRADAIRAALAAKEAAMQSNPDRAAFGFGGGIEQPARDGKPRAEAADDAYKLDEEKAAAKRAAEEKAAAERAAAREAAGQAAAERAEAKASAKAAKAAQKAERKAAKAAAKETAAQAKAIEKQAKETAEREERAAAQAKAAAEREEKAAAQEKETAEKLEAALAEIEAAAEPEPAAAETPVEFEPEPVAVEPEPIAVEPEPVAEIEIKSFEPEPAAVEPEPVAEIEVKPFEPEPAADAFNGQKPVLNPAELTPDMFDVLKPVAEPDEPAAGTFDGVKPVVKYTEPVADTFDDVKPAAEPDGPAADIADEPAAERPEQPAPAAEPGKTFKQAVGETVSFVWKNYTVWVLLGLALIIKLVLGLVLRGARPDLALHLGRIDSIFGSGSKYYGELVKNNGAPDAAPGQLYLYYYIALFKSWFGLTDGGTGLLFFFKLPSLIFDLATGWLLYSTAKKFISKDAGLAVAALYLFNPALILAFNVWGSFTAVWVFFLVLAFRYALERKIIKLAAAYTLAVFFAAEALTAAPLVLIYLLVLFVKAFSAYSRETAARKGSVLLSSQKYRALWETPLAVAVFFLGLFLISLPFTVHEVGDGKVFYYVTVFKELCLDFEYFTYNAFGISGLTGRNGQLYGDTKWVMTVLYFFMCAILAAVYLMKRNRANLVLLCSFLFLITAVFMLNASPLSMVPALVLLLFAVIAIGDRRLIGQYFILSLVSLFNIGAVMVNGLYLNGLPDYMFSYQADVYMTDYVLDYTNNSPDYINRMLLGKGLMLAGSILALLSFVYFMLIVMDITVTNKRKLFLKHTDRTPVLRPDSFLSIFH